MTDKEITDENKMARHNQWRIIRRLNAIIILIILSILSTLLHHK